MVNPFYFLWDFFLHLFLVPQIGSYFGSELCPLDVDQDGLTDYLLVGAPFFHIHGEEGKVYIYRLDKDVSLFTSFFWFHARLEFSNPY